MKTRTEIQKHWAQMAEGHLKGRTVKAVRYLTEKEREGLLWPDSVPVIEFDDGTLVLPASDEALNRGGALFGQTSDKKELLIPRVPA